MKKSLHRCLLVLVTVSVAPFLISATFAPAMVVPCDVQLGLFVNIWKLDRAFHPAGTVTMAVVYQQNFNASVFARDDIVAAALKSSTPIRCVAVEAGSQELLRKRMSDIQADVVYVAPLRAVDVAEITTISRRRGLRTMTGVPEYAEAGLAVAIGTRKNRPLIIINLEGARAEGSDFSSQLLNLARIVGPIS